MNASNVTLPVAANKLPWEEVAIWYYIMMVCSFVGTVLLVLLLIVQYQLGKFRTGSGVLIAHTLIVELSICAVHTPLQTIAFLYSYHNWPYGFSCRNEQIASIISYHAENWGALFLALNRVVGIIFPHHYAQWTSKRALVAMISLSWLIPVGLNMLTVTGTGVQVLEMPPASNKCILKTYGPFALLWSVMTVYIPLASTCSIYALIWLKIKLKTTVTPAQGERVLAKRVLMLKVLFAASVWYAISMLVIPISLVVWKGITPRALMWMRVYQLLGSAASPVIFFSLNVECRTKLLDLIRLVGTSLRVPMSWLQKQRLRASAAAESGGSSTELSVKRRSAKVSALTSADVF